jgi:hypothetical protein
MLRLCCAADYEVLMCERVAPVSTSLSTMVVMTSGGASVPSGFLRLMIFLMIFFLITFFLAEVIS